MNRLLCVRFNLYFDFHVFKASQFIMNRVRPAHSGYMKDLKAFRKSYTYLKFSD